MNEYYKTKRMRVSEWYRTWLKFVCRIIYSSPYYSLFTDLGWDVCQFNYHLLLANFEFNFRKWNLLLASKLAKVPVERLQAGWRWLPGLFIETQFLYIYWNIAREELYSQCKVCSSSRQWPADHQDLSVNQWKSYRSHLPFKSGIPQRLFPFLLDFDDGAEKCGLYWLLVTGWVWKVQIKV